MSRANIELNFFLIIKFKHMVGLEVRARIGQKCKVSIGRVWYKCKNGLDLYCYSGHPTM